MLFYFALIASLSPVARAAEVQPKDRLVVLCTVDGLPAWLWKDPALVMPNVRRLAAEGAVVEHMSVSNPSITWINHTTLVTGVTPRKHGVLFNGLLVRRGAGLPPIVEPWTNKADLVHSPTIYDVAYKAGLETAQVDWVAILNSGTITHEFLEIPKPEGPIEQALVADSFLSDEDVLKFSKRNIVWRDWVWTRAARHIVEKHKPNLLLFHLLGTDAVNHQYGPGSTASFSAYAYTDGLIGDLLDSIARAGLNERATVIVTTDHGFKRVSKVIHPNVVLRKANLLRAEGNEARDCKAYVMVQGGMAFVYVTDPNERTELVPKLRSLLEGVEGVAQVLDGMEGPKLGMPTPEENQGMGDLVLFAKAGYAFKGDCAGDSVVAESRNYLGTHGYLASDPELDGVLIAWGSGIRVGARMDRISNVDIAPTIAKLLNLSLPDTDGTVLKELLNE